VITEIGLTPLIGFLLAMVRVTSWMLLTPPFQGRTIPAVVKVGTAAALSLVIAPQLPVSQATLDPATLLPMVLVQAVTGLLFGAFTYIVFSAIHIAGQYIDIFGGFTMSMSFDPFLNAQSSTFGRFYNMVALVLLFVTNGHLLLIKGFATSFQAIPLTGLSLENIEALFFENMTYFSLAAIEIAAPILGAFFLTEVTLGLLTKAAPQMQILMFAFPLKVFVTILMVAIVIPIVVPAEKNIVNQVLETGAKLLGG
jgi:flagellar biosynthetic protein FliR